MPHVLVIEDDRSIREMLSQALEIEGYKVSAAANGAEGIRLLNEGPLPGVILLDLMMPVMNGWQFMEAKKALPPNLQAVPVAVISAYSERAQELPCQAILKKPIDLDVLLEMVEKYCGDQNA